MQPTHSDQTDFSIGNMPIITDVSGSGTNPDENRPGTDENFAAPPAIDKSSILQRRRRFVFALTAFTIGTLILGFCSPQRNDFLAPGPLSSSHAQILNAEGTDRCASCHGAGNQTFLSWISDTLTGSQTISIPQSEKCLECHSDMKSDTALLAHNLTSDQIRVLTARYEKDYGPRSTNSIFTHNAGDTLACSKCHVEHHGSMHNLAALTDSQCQTCHHQQFAAFETGHPEFSNYPLKRRSRIAFDHVSHFGKHFRDMGKSVDCKQCHIDDSFQNVKQLASFEQSCASCHDNDIQSSITGGIELLSLPLVDVDALESAGVSIGQWPDNCTGDFDGRLTPLTKLLLLNDDSAQKAMTKLEQAFGSSFEFGDIDPENAEQVRAAADIVWALKALLHDLATGQSQEIESRVSNETDSRSLILAKSWSNQFDAVSARQAVFHWMPNLNEEIADRRQKQARSATRLNARIAKFSRSLDDELLAENPLQKLMADSNNSAGGSNTTDNPSKQESDEKIANQDQRPNQTDPTKKVEVENPKVNRGLDPKVTGTIPNQFFQGEKGNQNKSAQEDDWLVKNPLSDLLNHRKPNQLDPIQSQNPDNVVKPPSQIEKSPGQIEKPNGVANSDPLNKPEQPKQSASIEELLDAIQKSRQQKKGIWYLDRSSYSLRYQPVGHADPFLKGLSEVATQTSATKSHEFLDQLLSPTSFGNCMSCHTVDQLPNSKIAEVNWQSKYRDPMVRQWTNFSHRPHLMLPQTSDCQSCHELDTSQANAQSFVGRDPGQAISNFKPILKNNCVTCHQKNSASSSCTTCHSYHVGSPIKSQAKKSR